MAPIGMVLGEVLSPEAGIISAVMFLVLSVVGVVLCAQCQRKGGNAYDISEATTADAGKNSSGVNGKADTKTGDTTDNLTYTTWRDHKSMPASTLERDKAYTQ